MQFPPYVVPRPAAFGYLAWAQDQLGGDEMLVEFRHGSWLDDEHRDETLAFLERHGMTYVIVDAPRTGGANVLPTVVATTSPTAYVRFHGRNAETWNKRVRSAAERFDYLYPEEELRDWLEPLQELAGKTESVYAMFNNNGRSTVGGETIAQAPVNAQMLKGLLQEAQIAV